MHIDEGNMSAYQWDDIEVKEPNLSFEPGVGRVLSCPAVLKGLVHLLKKAFVPFLTRQESALDDGMPRSAKEHQLELT
jgi:hypothetical protein